MIYAPCIHADLLMRAHGTRYLFSPFRPPPGGEEEASLDRFCIGLESRGSSATRWSQNTDRRWLRTYTRADCFVLACRERPYERGIRHRSAEWIEMNFNSR